MNFTEIYDIRTKTDAWRNWDKKMVVQMSMLCDPMAGKVWYQVGQQVYFQSVREIHRNVFNRFKSAIEKSLKR